MYTRRSSRFLRTGGTLLAAALLISACSAGASTNAATSAADVALAALPRSTPAALAPYYGQKARWHSCGDPGFECATLKVPLDYDRTADGDVRLAVARKKATGPGKRLGSLFVNPGGPGGSAIGYLQAYAGIGYPAAVRARYDMVAVDPRGVARSEPVECLDGRDMDSYAQTDITPDDARETTELVDAYKKFAEGCGAHSAKLLRHVSTVETARDMDIVRAALGDAKLNYVGASYGTFLGATYAGLFPGRSGRLVLDGAMDPSLPASRLNLDQTVGFETAFQSFAKDCAQQPDCPLGTKTTTTAQAGQKLRIFFAKLDAHPIPTGDADRRSLGEALATTGVIAAMYDESSWAQLREALGSAMKEKDGAALLVLADSYYARGADGRYSNLMSANAAVNCLDLPPAFGSRRRSRRPSRPSRRRPPSSARASPGPPSTARTGRSGPRVSRTASRRRAPPRSSWSAPPAIRPPPTAGPDPWPPSSPRPACSPTTATVTPPTAAAAPASTPRSTRICSAAPLRWTGNAAPSPGHGTARGARGLVRSTPGNCVDLPTLLTAPWCGRRAALAQMARATHS